MTNEKPNEKILNLETEIKNLQEEIWRLKRKPEGEISYILLAAGIILIALSLLHSNSIAAYIGIALIFWGALLLYAKPIKFMKKDLLEPSIINLMENIENVIKEMNYQGTPIYISPVTISTVRNVFLLIPKHDQLELPSNENIFQNNLLYNNAEIIKLIPPGFDLSKLYEKELNTNFSINNLKYLENNLEKLFIDGLEIMKSIKMENKEPIITIILTDTIFDDIIDNIIKNKILSYIGEPLSSSIACMIALITNRRVKIQNITQDKLSKVTKITYEIIN